MGKMSVAYNGKPLFEWSGDEVEIANLEAKVREIAQSGSVAPEELATSVVVHLKETWTNQPDPGARQAMMMAVVYFLLELDTRHREHPGKYREYVPVWDFHFDINVEHGKINVAVGGKHWPIH